MNMQKKKEKPGILLLLPKSEKAGEPWWIVVRETAHLEAEAYKNVVSLWVERGCLAWLRGDEPHLQRWRDKLGSHLKNGSDRRKKIIRDGTKRPNWSEQENVRHWVEEADGDPLMFLNLAGVPPLDTLFMLEDRKRQMDLSLPVWKRFRFRKEGDKEEDIAHLTKAARVLDSYELLLGDYIKIINRLEGKDDLILTLYNPTLPSKNKFPIPDKYPKGDGLRAIAEIIRNAKTLGLIPSSWEKEDKRGGARKAGFPHVVKDLTRIAQRHLGERWEKVSWGAITALLMAAFPEWFKRDEDPVRNVKNAYKAKINVLDRRIGVIREVGGGAGGKILHTSRERELR